MKRRTWLIVISALSLVGSLALVGQTSAGEKTDFFGTDKFCPPEINSLNLCGPVAGSIVDEGTVTCIGGELKGNPLFPCSEETIRIKTRGYIIKTIFDTGNDLVDGEATISINANYDAESNGPGWGTISINPDAYEGTWDGTWTGKSVREGEFLWTITVHASIQGHGDGVDGMLYRAVDTITAYTPGVAFYDGILEGWILDPHSK